jgi:DNA-binding response OmpR family regulator
MARKSILVVDDEKSQREILEMILSGEGYDVTTASSGEAAMKFVESRRFDLVLTDLKMTGMSGLDLLKELTNYDKSIIVILLTAHGSVDSAVDALRLGAFDYLQKPYDSEKLLETVSRALNKLTTLDTEIVSVSPEMDGVKKLILKIAKSSSTVLSRGDSGTGKELIARSIHKNSLRSNEIFQAVNCAAINENLLESELLATKKVRLQAPSQRRKVCSRSRTAGPCFWTRSANSTSRYRQNCCVLYRKSRYAASAALRTSTLMSGSWPRRTATFSKWLRKSVFAKTFTIASTSFRSMCRRFANAGLTFPC